MFSHDPAPPKVHDPKLSWYLKEADDIADTLCGFSMQGRQVQIEMMHHIYKRLSAQFKRKMIESEEHANAQRVHYETLQKNYLTFLDSINDDRPSTILDDKGKKDKI